MPLPSTTYTTSITASQVIQPIFRNHISWLLHDCLLGGSVKLLLKNWKETEKWVKWVVGWQEMIKFFGWKELLACQPERQWGWVRNDKKIKESYPNFTSSWYFSRRNWYLENNRKDYLEKVKELNFLQDRIILSF